MKKIIKVLSHRDRVSCRILSGGSQIYQDQEGRALVEEIEKGFFEKRTVNDYQVIPSLYLPINLFNTFRKVSLN